MRGQRNFAVVMAVLAVVATSLVTAGFAAAQTQTVIYSFLPGEMSSAGLIFDASGNLYGTTQLGGTFAFGTAFELSPSAGGGWTQTILHNFCSGKDGCNPESPLVMDGAGNLYGTTWDGGTYSEGTVFELTPMKEGGWKETILHDFAYNGGTDGSNPTTGLVLDAAGNLYGTTSSGGTGVCTNVFNAVIGCGTVFELSPEIGGAWTEKILYNIPASQGSFDGTALPSGLIFDSTGNLYGTTRTFGEHDAGVVFELLRNNDWHAKILYNFGDSPQAPVGPTGGLVFDSKGNLYGTTPGGGTGSCFPYSCGTVFELTNKSGQGWVLKVLHNFNYNGKDGFSPASGVVIGAAGNLYGTTGGGGTGCVSQGGCGTMFELSPTESGGWREKILHNFDGGAEDGDLPFGSLVFDASGNLFGTTEYGGANGAGIIYNVTL